MKIIYLLLISLSFSSYAATETVAEKDYIGSWQQHKGFGIASMVNNWLNETENVLIITESFSVTLKRTFDDGGTQIFTTPKNNITFSDDFLIIPFSKDNKLRYKLVISGWRSEYSKLIFGTLYLYNEGQLFNGIPVTFEPKAVNKSLNLTGAKNAPPS